MLNSHQSIASVISSGLQVAQWPVRNAAKYTGNLGLACGAAIRHQSFLRVECGFGVGFELRGMLLNTRPVCRSISCFPIYETVLI